MSADQTIKCLICSGNNKVMISLQEALSGLKFTVAQLLENLNFLTISDWEKHQLCFVCVSKIQFCYKFKTQCSKVQKALNPEAHSQKWDTPDDISDIDESKEVFLVQSDSDEEMDIKDFENDTKNVILMDKKGKRTTVEVFDFSGRKKKTKSSVQILSKIPGVNENLYKPPIIVCPICYRSLHSVISYRRHYQTHTGEKPFVCDVCKNQFAQLGQLLRHKAVHDDIRPFSCEICHKAFKLKTTLKKHHIIHTELKPYTCDVCDKSFRFAKTCKVHKRLHFNIKPYICDVCDKAFARKDQLKSHFWIHSETKPYTCDLCGQGFVYKSTFLKHVEDKHPDATSYLHSIIDKPKIISID